MAELLLVKKIDAEAQPIFRFEAPKTWKRKTRWLTLAGWCVWKNGPALREVRVIAGEEVYRADSFHTRPDVLEQCAVDASQLHCGFLMEIMLPRGNYPLRVEASNGGGDPAVLLEKRIAVPKHERRIDVRREQLSRPNRFFSWLDRPASWDYLERDLPICGWCIDRLGERITAFRARVEKKTFHGTYGIQRGDLRQIPELDLPFAHCAGFAVMVRLPPGCSTLTLEVRCERSGWRPFFERQVKRSRLLPRTKRPPLPDAELFDVGRRDVVSRFAFWLEPRCDWSRLPRVQRLVGWCIALSGEPLKAVRVRIGRRVWQANTGMKRPEVKAAYPEVSEALQSGFSVTIRPPRGRNLLVLEARSGEEWERVYAQRIHRPLFWRRGENRFGQANRYDYWLRLYGDLSAHDRAAIRRQIATLKMRPRFSVLIPCYNSEPRFLRAAIESVKGQLYSNWEICAVDDASDQSAVWSTLQKLARREPRLKIARRLERGHISTASNDALREATGEFIVLLDHDDELAPEALYLAALEINQEPEVRLIYADEDKIDENGRRFNPYFKPQWNPDLLLAQNYAIHPLIVHTDLARAAGGFDSACNGAQDHDFVLRCAERISPAQIKRIPRLLYHWRTVAGSTADALAAKPYALEARKRAVEAHLARRGVSATILTEGDNQRVQFPAPTALVSIIIPTRDRAPLLRNCLRSIQEKTTYPRYEIIIVDNGSMESDACELLQRLREEQGIKVLSAPGEFNYSRLCNSGARLARGEVLLLLNNDVEVLNGEWLQELTSQAMRPEIGVVGAQLWFPDGRLQHGGIVLHPQRIGSYAFFKRTRGEPGYFSQLRLVRNASAVTGACLALRAEVYARVGGLNESDLAIAFNDIDLCLRVQQHDLRVTWTPHAELVHHESSSRGLEDTAEKQARFHREIHFMRQQWGRLLEDDPFYNPNLDLTDELFTLAFPPRRRPFWQKQTGQRLPRENGSVPEYAFGFDQALEPMALTRSPRLSGWLVNTAGESISGIRVIASKPLRRRHIERARRKRSRPDIGAAFPQVVGAESSGFEVKLPLRVGQNQIVFQAQDVEKRWRTFFQTSVRLLPLDFLQKSRLHHLHAHLARRLRNAQTSRPFILAGASSNIAPAPHIRAASPPARMVIFATSKSNLFIREVGELVAAGFREIGYPVECRYDEAPRGESEDVLEMVLTPHEFYNLFLLEKKDPALARELTRHVVLLSTEQPNTAWYQQNLRWAPWARATADINRMGVEAYRAHGVRALSLPLGFSDFLAHPHQPRQQDRSVDITFLGSLTPRRESFFSRHAAYFAAHECHLRFVPLGFAKTEQTRSYLSPEKRNALLADTKILLNVHYSDQPYFEWHRMLLGLANGCCIITEPCQGYGPLVPNKHFVMVSSESLVEATEYYLAHPEARQQIAVAGQAFIRTQLRQAKMCERFLREYSEMLRDPMRVSPLPPDPAPLPPSSALAAKLSSLRHGMGGALLQDLRNLRHPPRPAENVIERQMRTSGSPDVRQALVANRAGYQTRRREQEKESARGGEVWNLFDNHLYSGAETPKLSVLVTLFNYGQYIEQCLRSVGQSKVNCAMEVIIIDDASTDDSLARARRVQERFAHPVRIIQKRFNTGLADARNVGLEFARAPFVFMLDADNLVFPRALPRLLEAIEAGPYAAAFSLLCRFRNHPAAGIGLLSYYDWDPEALVQSPYIDAMALFRRDVLRESGGYDHTLSEIAWFGWEDYEMWLRFAARELPVAFVPNILCLYRQHQTSMIQNTNLFEAELVELFRERYQSLIDRYPAREKLFGLERSER